MKRYISKEWWLKFWRESKGVLLTILVLCAVRSAIADWNDVPSGSMNPTILQGDRVLVNKLAYDLKVPFTTWHVAQWSNPQRGDIVVFFSPVDGTRLVKRVIGLPGDRIELNDDHLFINGHAAAYQLLPQSAGREVPADGHGPRLFATETAGQGPNHTVTIHPWAPARRNFGPIIVPAGHYFMMGDNRDDSYDSRFWGGVERDRIVGKVPLVVMSLNHERYYIPRWNRFFTELF